MSCGNNCGISNIPGFQTVTPAIPELYWGADSQEQRWKDICASIERLRCFTVSLVGIINEHGSHFAELDDAIEAEEVARIAADAQELADRIQAVAEEAELRALGDATLQSKLDDEIAARQLADGDLNERLEAEIAARQAAVATEQAARQAADNVLQANIDQEVEDRAQTLAAAVAAMEELIENEKEERIAAVSNEATLRGNADSAEAATRAQSINAERSARQLADGDLQQEFKLDFGYPNGSMIGEGGTRSVYQDYLDHEARIQALEAALL